jgi:hypothetical protein
MGCPFIGIVKFVALYFSESKSVAGWGTDGLLGWQVPCHGPGATALQPPYSGQIAPVQVLQEKSPFAVPKQSATSSWLEHL